MEEHLKRIENLGNNFIPQKAVKKFKISIGRAMFLLSRFRKLRLCNRSVKYFVSKKKVTVKFAEVNITRII